jgi:RNA polymerase sigma-70 factor
VACVDSSDRVQAPLGVEGQMDHRSTHRPYRPANEQAGVEHGLPSDRDEVAQMAAAVAPECDPELAFIKAGLRAAFVEAFKEALAELPQRERAILRFTFVERLTPGRIGAMYGVHRTTVMRWIEAAQEHILSSTRGRLMARLRLSPSECDSVLTLAKSDAQITLDSLLRTAS